MTTPRSIQRAIVCVAADRDTVDRAAECCAHCESQGYELVGIVVGTDHFQETLAMAERMRVDAVVVPRRGMLPLTFVTMTASLTNAPDLVELMPDVPGEPRAQHHVSRPRRAWRRRPKFIR